MSQLICRPLSHMCTVTFMSQPTCRPLSRIHCYLPVATNLSSAIAHTLLHSCRNQLVVCYIAHALLHSCCNQLVVCYIAHALLHSCHNQLIVRYHCACTVTYMYMYLLQPTCRQLSLRIHCYIHVPTNQLVVRYSAYIVTFMSQTTCRPLSRMRCNIHVATTCRPL